MLQDFIVIGLLTLAIMLTLIFGEQIDMFLHIVWVSFKDIFFKKNVPEVQGETQEQKQARFDSGASAGNELYAEGK